MKHTVAFLSLAALILSACGPFGASMPTVMPAIPCPPGTTGVTLTVGPGQALTPRPPLVSPYGPYGYTGQLLSAPHPYG